MADQGETIVDDVIGTEVAAAIELSQELNVEQLTHLLILSKVDKLKTDFAGKGRELKERQDKVRWIHDLMQSLNKRVNKETGELDLTHKKIDEKTGELKSGHTAEGDEELQALLHLRARLKDAKDKGYEIKVQGKYDKDERERMLENLKMSCDDLNLQNDMQLQDLNQLMNERYEVYQMARAIMKPLHDDKVHKARSISGR